MPQLPLSSPVPGDPNGGLSCRVGDGQTKSWEHARCQFEFDFPSCSCVGSTATSAMFFSHTCSDIKSILLHRCSRCQGLQAGSPQLPPGTSHTGGCRAPAWLTPPAPQKTSSPATPRPRSSKPSARSSCGCPRNRPPCRTSTADRPRLADLPSIRFPWKQDQEETNRVGVRQRTSVSWARRLLKGASCNFRRCHKSRDSS